MRAETSGRSASRQAPLIFGRYQVIAKIGEGGAGQVFLARAKGEAGFERLFALKVIRWHGDADRVGLTLQHEMKIASQVHHRNVVGILDFGSYPEGYYLVMEYVEGCTLSELQYRRQEERPPRLIVPVIIDALYGLHAAHSTKDETGASAQLVHRDVSPQNLLVGVDGACRVTDFGIARARNMMRTTRPHVVRGKPAYMSPEQIAGGEVDQRSDVFSTGIVLWNALTGKKLFHGPSEHVSMFNVLKRTVPKPSAIGLRPPAYLDALVMKALERDPARRFQSAEEMATALRDAAMRAESLGAPTEIAQWIERSFGPELEARRRTMREATDQAKVLRIDGDGTSLAAFSSVLPRLLGGGHSGVTDSVERLSVEDLSLVSDEVEDVEAPATPASEAPDAQTVESLSPPPRRGARRWGLILVAAALLAALLVLWRPWGKPTEKTATPARPSDPGPSPAVEAPRIQPPDPARAPPIPAATPAPTATAPAPAAPAGPSDGSGPTPVVPEARPEERAPAKPTRQAAQSRSRRNAVEVRQRPEEVPVARPDPPAEPAPAPSKNNGDGGRVLETNPYLMK